MKNDLSAPLGHFLQTDIMSKLAAADIPVRFTDLKGSGVENSLFMYHANKLIDRGLIHKTAEGFTLTIKGVRWANYNGIFHDFAIATPRPLVQFIIKNLNDNILIAERKGQLRSQLNDFLLPGNIYRYGLTLDENVKLILEEIFGDTPLPEAISVTTADVIHRSEDEFVNHVIAYIYRLQFSSEVPRIQDHPLFTTEWIALQEIRADNPLFAKSIFLPSLFGRLPDIQAHEVFQIKS